VIDDQRQDALMAERMSHAARAPVAAVAAVMRDSYRARGEPATRLVIPCFHSGRPWQTICSDGLHNTISERH
jgi:hypothetical protein